MTVQTSIADKNFQISPPRPWCRYFARVLDIALYGPISLFVILVALSVVFPDFVESLPVFFKTSGGKLIKVSLFVFLSGFLSAVLIGYTGTSIGKWFFGVSVTDHEGLKIGFKRAWQREMKVWWRGLAMAVPLISLYANYAAYKRLVNTGHTSWDDQMNLRIAYRDEDMLQTVKMIIGFILIIILLAI